MCTNPVIYQLAPSKGLTLKALGCRLMVGQRILVPSVRVRLLPPQPKALEKMARSSSGLGRRPLKAEITSSNLVRATNFPGLPNGGRFVFPNPPHTRWSKTHAGAATPPAAVPQRAVWTTHGRFPSQNARWGSIEPVDTAPSSHFAHGTRRRDPCAHTAPAMSRFYR